jgi:hypothetical protein
MNLVHTTLLYSLNAILILSSYLRLGLPTGYCLSGFPTKTLYTFLISLYTCYMPVPSHRPWYDDPSTDRKLQIGKFLFIRFLQPPVTSCSDVQISSCEGPSECSCSIPGYSQMPTAAACSAPSVLDEISSLHGDESEVFWDVALYLVVQIKPLRPSGNYMDHLLWQSVMLHFVFIGFVWFSL